MELQFGLSVVAEGVETAAQRTFLANIGCFCYQGFLFADALPIEQFNACVEQARTARVEPWVVSKVVSYPARVQWVGTSRRRLRVWVLTSPGSKCCGT